MTRLRRGWAGPGWGLGVLGVGGLKAGGVIAGGEGAVGDGNDGEAFGGSETGAVPPVATDRAGSDEGDAVPIDALIDVGVALEDGEDVVAFEELDDGGAVDEGAGGWGLGAVGGVAADGGDEGNVGGDDDRGAGGLGGEIVREPLELVVVDLGEVLFSFFGVGADADGIEDDEVVGLVVEGVEGGAEAVLEEFLGVEGVRGGDAGGGVDAADVMVAEGVVDFEAEGLLGLVVELEEFEGAGFGDGEGVKDVVAALDGEVSVEGGGLGHGELGALDAIELGLGVGVGEEEEGEVALGGRGRRCRSRFLCFAAE